MFFVHCSFQVCTYSSYLGWLFKRCKFVFGVWPWAVVVKMHMRINVGMGSMTCHYCPSHFSCSFSLIWTLYATSKYFSSNFVIFITTTQIDWLLLMDVLVFPFVNSSQLFLHLSWNGLFGPSQIYNKIHLFHKVCRCVKGGNSYSNFKTIGYKFPKLVESLPRRPKP